MLHPIVMFYKHTISYDYKEQCQIQNIPCILKKLVELIALHHILDKFGNLNFIMANLKNKRLEFSSF